MESRRELWVERVAGWRRSGQTAKEYAASIGVRWGTLTNWAWRLSRVEQATSRGRRRSPRILASPTLIEVVERHHHARDERFELQLPGERRLCIPAGFDPAALRRLLEVLDGVR